MIDHRAVIMAHPNIIRYCDSYETYGYDQDGNKVTLDLELVAAKTVELEKLNYQQDRKREYPSIGEQLDYIYHNGIDKWKTDVVDPVKTKYPKPE